MSEIFKVQGALYTTDSSGDEQFLVYNKSRTIIFNVSAESGHGCFKELTDLMAGREVPKIFVRGEIIPKGSGFVFKVSGMAPWQDW